MRYVIDIEEAARLAETTPQEIQAALDGGELDVRHVAGESGIDGDSLERWLIPRIGQANAYARLRDMWSQRWERDSVRPNATITDVLAHLAVHGRPITGSTWRAYVARGQAPAPHKHVGRTPLWHLDDVDAWLGRPQSRQRPWTSPRGWMSDPDMPISAGGFRFDPADAQDMADFAERSPAELRAMAEELRLDFSRHPAMDGQRPQWWLHLRGLV